MKKLLGLMSIIPLSLTACQTAPTRTQRSDNDFANLINSDIGKEINVKGVVAELDVNEGAWSDIMYIMSEEGYVAPVLNGTDITKTFNVGDEVELIGRLELDPATNMHVIANTKREEVLSSGNTLTDLKWYEVDGSDASAMNNFLSATYNNEKPFFNQPIKLTNITPYEPKNASGYIGVKGDNGTKNIGFLETQIDNTTAGVDIEKDWDAGTYGHSGIKMITAAKAYVGRITSNFTILSVNSNLISDFTYNI